MDTLHPRTPSAERDNTAGSSHRAPRHTDLHIDRSLIDWMPPDAIGDDARAFRDELGLPTDRPVVMTGHQPVFWHAGILTKYLAIQAIANKHATPDRPIGTAWCVPDHVTPDPGVVAFPAKNSTDSPGAWVRREADLFDAPEDLPPALESARRELDRSTAQTDPRPADRQIRAHASILDERLGLRTASPIVLATAIGRTRRFAGVLGAMLADPVECVRRYNTAAAAHPDAGVRPLALGSDPDETELPIWRLTTGGAPESIRAGEIADAEPGTLVPRALLFTGLLRALGCDLFIHGTGGGVYDKVTEDWLASWLGPDMGWTLAPTGVATATLTLELGIPDVSVKDLRHARWRAHNAMHNPRTIGATAELKHADDTKRALFTRIRAAAHEDREPLYFEMHRLLEGVRAAHAPELAAIDGEVGRIEAALADRSIATDRTWPWMLHDDADLRALHEAVIHTIGGEG